MKGFLKRLKWCCYILAGKRFVVFFPRMLSADTVTSCKNGEFSADDWNAIANLTDACAEARAQLETIALQEATQQALLREALSILERPRSCP
jgi:hypothetical protein